MYLFVLREISWIKVCFVVFLIWCFACKVETTQNGLNHEKINDIGENSIKNGDSHFHSDEKLYFGLKLSFFHFQLIVFTFAVFSWESLLHYTMRTIWNILFPLTIITAGTYNSLRPAISTVGNQTWAVGLLSLKALKQTTKLPKYSWYGLQMLLKLINVKKSANKKNKRQQIRPRRQSRNRYFMDAEGVSCNQDDEDGEEEQTGNPMDDELQSFLKTSESDGAITSQFGLRTSKSAVDGDAVASKKPRHVRKRRGCMVVFKRPTQRSFLTVYRTIPLRLFSRVWGRLMRIRLPKPLRKPIIYIYSTVYGCNLTEISLDDVSGYTCLGEFFRRRLRPEVRPIDASAPLTSPADGKIVTSGKVQNSMLEQIKGVSYSLSEFLGSITWRSSITSSAASATCTSATPNVAVAAAAAAAASTDSEGRTSASTEVFLADSQKPTQNGRLDQQQEQEQKEQEEEEEEQQQQQPPKVSVEEVAIKMSASFPVVPMDFASALTSTSSSTSSSTPPAVLDLDEQYQRRLCINDPKTHKLHHLVVYLAPGDYHRFHSPADWTVTFRRHFPGDLFSVAPLISRWISGLFNYNERVLYAGFWDHGFFSLTAVGATGVGSIRTSLDPNLSTNEYKWNPRKENHQDLDFTKDCPGGIRVSKGDEFGEFNLGSTIVLVFEAPNNFQFQVNDADKVKVGRSVGQLGQTSKDDQAVGGNDENVNAEDDEAVDQADDPADNLMAPNDKTSVSSSTAIANLTDINNNQEEDHLVNQSRERTGSQSVRLFITDQ